MGGFRLRAQDSCICSLSTVSLLSSLNFTTLPLAHVLYPHDEFYDSGKRSSERYN